MRCFEDVFHVALMNRLHMENSRIHILNDWIVVEPIVFCIEDFEISLTMPMPRPVVVRMGNQQKSLRLRADAMYHRKSTERTLR